jgi:hypothetical protein
MLICTTTINGLAVVILGTLRDEPFTVLACIGPSELTSAWRFF